MGFNCCEIWRNARIAGQPERRPIGFYMTSITDRAVKVNSHYSSFYKRQLLDARNRYFTGRMPCSRVQSTVNSNLLATL